MSAQNAGSQDGRRDVEAAVLDFLSKQLTAGRLTSFSEAMQGASGIVESLMHTPAEAAVILDIVDVALSRRNENTDMSRIALYSNALGSALASTDMVTAARQEPPHQQHEPAPAKSTAAPARAHAAPQAEAAHASAPVHEAPAAKVKHGPGWHPVAGERPKPAVPPEDSVHHEFIICLEDGRRMSMLKRHLQNKYGMSGEDYIKRWELPDDYPLVCPAYSEKKSDGAKKHGLGRKNKAPAPLPHNSRSRARLMSAG